MKVKVDDILNELRDLINASIFRTDARLEGPYQYRVKQQWPDTMPHTRNGIYFFSDMAGEVLYIGKGVFSNNDGIGYRICSHLGATNKDPDRQSIFPSHQWINDQSVEPELRSTIEAGDFLIWTLPVQPDYMISMIEVCLQTIYWHRNSRLPKLNKKLG